MNSTSCEVPAGRSQRRRGWFFIAMAFVFCPCHLPVTLVLFSTLLGGTMLGGLMLAHAYIVAAVFGVLWIAGTIRGFLYLGEADRAR
jgi:hypothetical protein